MKKSKVYEAKRWFLQVQRDLDDAKFNLSGERFNVACFLAQQSAEKAMKAYLIFKLILYGAFSCRFVRGC